MEELSVCQLETIEYRAGVALQEQIRERIHLDDYPEVLLLLEHPPVYTRGRRSDDSELPLGEEWYRSKGIDIVQTDRGGKLTYHGPGQLVGYPIMRIDDVIKYLRTMEKSIIAALAEEGIEGSTREGRDYTGVWVEDRKIASIGLHVQRGITTHGFAINVDNDLAPFEWVTACGLAGVKMTSIGEETGRKGVLPTFRQRMAYHFCEAFGRDVKPLSGAGELEERYGRLEAPASISPIA